THVISYNIALVPIEERTKSSTDIADELRAELVKIPEIVDFTINTSQGMGSFGGSAVEVEVYGYNIASTNVVAEELAGKIRNMEGTRDVTISRDKSKPELQIILDQEKM